MKLRDVLGVISLNEAASKGAVRAAGIAKKDEKFSKWAKIEKKVKLKNIPWATIDADKNMAAAKKIILSAYIHNDIMELIKAFNAKEMLQDSFIAILKAMTVAHGGEKKLYASDKNGFFKKLFIKAEDLKAQVIGE